MTSPSLVDSHCHIDASDFDHDRDDAIARARAAGVTQMIVIGAGAGPKDCERAIDLCEQHSDLHATVGVHPHNVNAMVDAFWPRLEELARRPDVIGVGETGLDYYYDFSSPERQRECFAEFVDLAIAVDKPVICHIRDAHDDAVEILERNAAGRAQILIHCFTGQVEDARRYVDMGCYLSFSGIATFRGKSADPIREAVALVPEDRLLIETDCPYLAPVPMRGKRNEPAYLVHTAEAVARAAGMSATALAQVTTANARRLFRLTST